MKREDVYWATLIGLLSCQTYFQFKEHRDGNTDLPEFTLAPEVIQAEVKGVDLDCFPRNTKWKNDANSNHIPPQSFQCGDFQFEISSYERTPIDSIQPFWSETRALKEFGCDIDVDRIVCSEAVKFNGLTFYRSFTASFERIDQAHE